MSADDSVDSTLFLQSSLQKFIDHVRDLENEDDPSGDGFTREFRDIRDLGIKMREENTHPAEEGKKAVNVKKNRYRDILPFDETRVVLDEIPGEEGSDYVNANFIMDLNGYKSYIASQGPVQNTVYDFWRMILQYKVKVIAMACKLIEMGKKKCEQYWPDLENEPMDLKDIVVTLVSEENLADDCIKRILRADMAGAKPLMVTQFHYTGWPDHDIPRDFDVILEMIAEMREIKSLDPDKAPMIVHCSAGCGRTGTICAIDYAWELLKSGNMDDKFSLCEIVKRMREQRQSMIQAPEQYRMAHVTVQTLFQKHLDLIEDHTYGNVQFGDQEEQTTDASVSDAESNVSLSVYTNVRKNSALNMDIVKTIQKVTHVPAQDETITSENPPNLPEPLQPIVVHQTTSPAQQKQKLGIISAVYEAEPESDVSKSTVVRSPGIKEKLSMFSEDTKAFKVEKIDNIPISNVSPTGIEKRYLDHINNTKSDRQDKKLSFISTEERKTELEANKALFENNEKPKLAVKPTLSLDQSPAAGKSTTESNNNVEKPVTPAQRTPLQRIHSQQTEEKKHVTVLSVGGGGAMKAPVNKTVSEPAAESKPVQINSTKSKSFPSGTKNPVQGTPQSSVPPSTPVTQQDSAVYSYAKDPNVYSALSDYSSTYNVAGKPSVLPNAGKVPGMDDHYSELTNYSSNIATKTNVPTKGADYPYSYADENLKETADVKAAEVGKATNQLKAPSNPGVYSFAQPFPDSVYAAVDKPRVQHNGVGGDSVYESVTVGDAQNAVPPPIPQRGYLDDDDEGHVQEKSGAGDTTIGKAQRVLKTLIGKKTGSTPATSDHVTPSDIPGFKIRIGKKPKGPKEQPALWNKIFH